MKNKLISGCYYHIYNRGNNGENIFREKTNYEYFLERYWKYCYPVFDTYAYCLLKNHFHLLVKVRKEDEMQTVITDNDIGKKVRARLSNKKLTPKFVSQQLGHCFNGYTQAFNKKYGRTGSLFERPFKRKEITADTYFCELVCYIHKNPQKHHFVDDFRKYRYSSYKIFLNNIASRLNVFAVLNQFGGKENFLSLHDELARLPSKVAME